MSQLTTQVDLPQFEKSLRSTVAEAIREEGINSGAQAGRAAIADHAPGHFDKQSTITQFERAYESAIIFLDTHTIAFTLCDAQPLTHDSDLAVDIDDLADDVVKLAYVRADGGGATLACYPILETSDGDHVCTCASQQGGLWCAHDIAETILRNQSADADPYYIDA